MSFVQPSVSAVPSWTVTPPPQPQNTTHRAIVQVHPLDRSHDPIRLSAARLSIGQDHACDLVIEHPSVSRQHAEIRISQKGAMLLDLGSVNGLSVNGVRTKGQWLANGDHFQIGNFLFCYLASQKNLEPLYRKTIYSKMTRDGLTGLFNHQYLMETLSREWIRCRRHARPISILIANVDRFSSINERFGRMIGDQVLRQVAKRLQNIIRRDDVLSRTRGDTFAITMVEAGRKEAIEIAERFRLAVAFEPIVTSVGPIRTTISLGVASQAPQPSGNPDHGPAWPDFVGSNSQQATINSCNPAEDGLSSDPVSEDPQSLLDAALKNLREAKSNRK